MFSMKAYVRYDCWQHDNVCAHRCQSNDIVRTRHIAPMNGTICMQTTHQTKHFLYCRFDGKTMKMIGRNKIVHDNNFPNFLFCSFSFLCSSFFRSDSIQIRWMQSKNCQQKIMEISSTCHRRWYKIIAALFSVAHCMNVFDSLCSFLFLVSDSISSVVGSFWTRWKVLSIEFQIETLDINMPSIFCYLFGCTSVCSAPPFLNSVFV